MLLAWLFWQARAVRMGQMIMVSSARLWRSPLARRRVLTAAAVLGCFVWAMVVVGLSFAMVERGAPQWWLMLVFGMVVPVVTLVVVRGVRALANVRDEDRPRMPVVALAGDSASADPSPPAARSGRAGLVVAGGLPVEPLSGRELEVLEHLAAGRSNREIAKALYVAPGTVKAHLNRIFRKLGAASRLQAVTHARQLGLLEGPRLELDRP
jgi:DNA-binding CsgD family transcriptional regulator